MRMVLLRFAETKGSCTEDHYNVQCFGWAFLEEYDLNKRFKALFDSKAELNLKLLPEVFKSLRVFRRFSTRISQLKSARFTPNLKVQRSSDWCVSPDRRRSQRNFGKVNVFDESVRLQPYHICLGEPAKRVFVMCCSVVFEVGFGFFSPLKA